MPRRLTIEAPEYDQGLSVDVGDAECLLIGRAPNAAQAVLSQSGIPPWPVTEHTVAVPTVSANHALVWRSEGRVHLRDLGSRNGTWLHVPEDATLRFADEHDIRIRLASSNLAPALDRALESPRYEDGRDYGEALAQSVRIWLEHSGFRARVWASNDISEQSGIVALRLGSGGALFVQPERTVDESFDGRMAEIARFVAAQNALFAAEREMREDGVILASPAIRRVHRRIAELALQGLPSLVLLGPSGTGKERLAQAYHRHLGRSGPLVVINCSTLTRERMVADIFGAEAGSYTGAQRTMIGAVERADGGTLFLDEIGEMTLDVQPMLLRFLETGEFQRLGAIGRTRTADVRVVAATHRDLRRMVREGGFRDDLFFRLALEIVEVPPLRERFPDIMEYLHRQVLGSVSAYDALRPEALEVLRAHGWDGNFRELVNLVRRLPRSAERRSLTAESVQRAIEAGALLPPRSSVPAAPHGEASALPWTQWLQDSAAAFANDHEAGAPQSWGDMTLFIEQYLKPRALAHLAGVENELSLESVSLGKVAETVRADRGTVLKQLRRYFESLVRV